MVFIKTTIWSPDTCKCILEYKWDADLDFPQRKHTFKSIIKNCPFHSGLSGSNLYDTVLSENQRKNKLLSKLIEEVPSIVKEVTDERTLETRKLLSPRYDYIYTFSGQDDTRKLSVELFDAAQKNNVTLSAGERTRLQTFIDSDLGGSTKVEIL